MLTKKDAENNTWACIDYQELQRCCVVYGYSTLTPPEWGREKVRCGDIPSLVREIAIDIAISTYEDWKWDDVNAIYRNIIHYGIIEFVTEVE